MNELWEVIVRFSGDLEPLAAELSAKVELLGSNFAILTLDGEDISRLYDYPQIEYIELPKTLESVLLRSMTLSCIRSVQQTNYTGSGINGPLLGSGVMISILDSGVDYTHPDFISENGQSRIHAIWDQTIDGNPPAGFNMGSIYTREDINNALAQEDPFSVVPSTDTIGHGTAVAGIAAGNGRASKGENMGAAPESTLLVVKLGHGGESTSFARTTEIMRAVKFSLDQAKEAQMPLVINLSYGSSNGGHDGKSLFESYLDAMSQTWKTVIVVASGNEGNTAHHFSSRIEQNQTVLVEFSVSENHETMYLALWKSFIDLYSIELISPRGQSTGLIPQSDFIRPYVLDQTMVVVFYGQSNHYNIDQEIFFSFSGQGDGIRPGLWQLKVTGEYIVDSVFHCWLPSGKAGDGIGFLQPSPDTTLTIPSTAPLVLTVGGYDQNLTAPASFSGRGYTRDDQFVKPDLVAPSVNILCPSPGGSYSRQTGTSVAAPFVSGASALMMEWGIVRRNDPFLYGQRVKAFLQMGAKRGAGSFPNPQWGYGTLCLQNSMNALLEFTNRSLSQESVKKRQTSAQSQDEDLSEDDGDLFLEPDTQYRSEETTPVSPAVSEEYRDFIIYNIPEIIDLIKDIEGVKINSLESGFAVAFVPVAKVSEFSLSFSTVVFEPALALGLMDRRALEATGAIYLQNQPYLELTGKDVLVAIVDTGINYKLKDFKYADGTSRIAYLWDQSVNGNSPAEFGYGAEYSQEDINKALASENPDEIVPSNDVVGHGTALASLAAGSTDGEYIGAAPDSELIIVKLKKAKKYIYDNQLIPPKQDNAFETTDLAQGISYINKKASQLGRPVAICIGLGMNSGAHDGNSLFEGYISTIGGKNGNIVVCAAGNEALARHHADGTVGQGQRTLVELNVGERDQGVFLYMANPATDSLGVGVISPSGEEMPPLPVKDLGKQTRTLTLDKSEVSVEYFLPKFRSGAHITIVRIKNPSQGLWKIIVYGESVISGIFHIWGPITGFVSPETYFLTPNPNFTVTLPSTSEGIVVTGAYDPAQGRLYEKSSRGPTVGSVLPDIVAPGVNVGAMGPNGPGIYSGTSIATAITTGGCALMLEWAIVQNNMSLLNSSQARNFLIRSAKRERAREYPNNQWGYGSLDLVAALGLMGEAKK